MPNALRGFRLTIDDQNLSPGAKVEMARQIMFNESYAEAKESIMLPVRQYLKTMQARVTSESRHARDKTGFTRLLVDVLNGVLFSASGNGDMEQVIYVLHFDCKGQRVRVSSIRVRYT